MKIKILIQMEDAVKIIAQHLQEKGLYVENGVVKSHVEGQWEEQREVPIGIEYELEVK